MTLRAAELTSLTSLTSWYHEAQIVLDGVSARLYCLFAMEQFTLKRVVNTLLLMGLAEGVTSRADDGPAPAWPQKFKRNKYDKIINGDYSLCNCIPFSEHH